MSNNYIALLLKIYNLHKKQMFKSVNLNVNQIKKKFFINQKFLAAQY